MLMSTDPQSLGAGRDSKRTSIPPCNSNSPVNVELILVTDDHSKAPLAVKPSPMAVDSLSSQAFLFDKRRRDLDRRGACGEFFMLKFFLYSDAVGMSLHSCGAEMPGSC